MLATVYGITLRTQARIGRLAALGVLGALAVLIGVAIGVGTSTDQLGDGARFVNAYGLTVYTPVVALVFASASLGEPNEDGTLVYLWLRPVRRSIIVLGAWLATLTVVVPLVVLPLVLAAALTGGGGKLALGAAASSAIGVLAYTSVFTWLGLRVRRALVWGLAYILLWEGFVALSGQTASRLAIRSYTRSILSSATGVELRLAGITFPFTVAVPVLVSVAALALTVSRLRRMEVA
jgi:ABC-2 type transport system permease protein